jgi:epsin
MAVSISGLRRNIKNVAHNYTDAQVKVREATSNDPWGPSSTQMSEIADLTYNMVAFSEIMQMIWKRLNDHGKNWRHVYKALVLLEYLIKTGSEKVAQQCKENIFAIQTLKDFQFVEENKDQGLNVREKAKAMVALLKDDERLKNERIRALKAKERFAQSTAGIGSDTAFSGGQTEAMDGSPLGSPGEDPLKPDIELARPQTQGEEELQLQLALAMSREEADAEETKKKSDDMRLTLAIQKSKEEKKEEKEKGSALNDLVDLNFGGPVTGGPNPPQRTAASLDPWSPMGEGASATGGDPWGGITTSTIPDPWGGIGAVGVPPSRASPLAFPSSSPPRPSSDPWGSATVTEQANTSGGHDPWGAPADLPPSVSPAPVKIAADPFSPADPNDVLSAFGGNGHGHGGGGAFGGTSPLQGSVSPNIGAQQTRSPNPWDLSGLDPMAGQADLLGNNLGMNTGAKPKKIVESLLGEHSNLVNLDNLVQPKVSAGGAKNPFADQPNPFQAAAAPKPTINQLRTGGQPSSQMGSWPDNSGVASNNTADINPFF